MKNEEQQIREKLGDKMWRLISGKLYKIKDKNGNIIPFIPNEHQLYYFNNKHTLNVIPKARQKGYSTAIEIDFFDDFLFTRNINVGVIADTDETAREIFRDKIQIAWDNLPQWLKQYYKINTDKANELSFENTGSKFFVKTSTVGMTLQRLHISEFGKICQKYPLKADEIMKSLESVGKGNIVTIESTARGGEGYFYELCRMAKESEDLGRELTHLDWKLFFSPWWDQKEYRIDGNIAIPNDLIEYFDSLDKEHGIKLDQQQKNWYFLKKKTQGEGMFSEYPSTYDEAFIIAMDGNYFIKELNIARQQKRVCNVNYDTNLPVHSVWDIGGAGGGDDTSIWFWQEYGSEIRIIDYWEGNRMSLIEICQKIVKTKPYNYGTHYFPHDANVTEYTYGETRLNIAKRELGNNKVEVLPRVGKSDAINNVRQLIARMYFDEGKTVQGINHLNKYRRAWNETHGFWLDRPEHNEHIHCGDAFTYLGQAIGLHNYNKSEDIVAEIINLEWNV